jgi:hypothetical protein
MKFEFVQFNPRRLLRGAEGARVKVTYESGSDLLWMSEQDIRRNIMWYGKVPGLMKALEAYKLGVEFDAEASPAGARMDDAKEKT